MSHKRTFEEYKSGLTHLPRPGSMDPAPRAFTPPPIQAPTAKEKKYDRQLRLWAAAGQKALEESHVLLVVGDEVGANSSVAGAETIKNLILPSIGQFTIADSATVKPEDLGVNFFLELESLGRSRAEEATNFLQELNPDVKGNSITRPLSEWLSDETALHPYNLIIICAPISTESLQQLTSYALSSSIPLIYIHCVGFQAYFSVQLPQEFPIVDTHPDPDSISDLRLLAPWSELEEAADALGDIDSMPDHEHGHIPYILILLHHLKTWKASHDNTYPTTFKDKTAFREQVRASARTSNAEGGEENFDEACAAVLKTIAPPNIGSGCREMFTMSSCTSPTATSSNFWLIAHAINKFCQSHSVLPLPGSLPDMKATSADYIKLQNIYKSKARTDVAEVTSTVRELEASFKRSVPVPAAEIEAFCKNASHVRVLTNPSSQPISSLRLAKSDPKTISALSSLLTNYQTLSQIFIAMNSTHLSEDIISSLQQVETEPENALKDALEEFKRCQGAELHNTASIIGGMAAQEAIKLITAQYIPVDGTCVWDGIGSRTEVFKL